MSVLEELKKIVAEKRLKVDLSDATLNTPFKELGLDSLDVFDVIVSLEKTLNIHLPDEVMMSLQTVNDLITAIEKMQSGN